jgi:hypothetical protein
MSASRHLACLHAGLKHLHVCMLEHLACLHAGLKDKEEYLLDQMFVIEGLRSELSGKCQARVCVCGRCVYSVC